MLNRSKLLQEVQQLSDKLFTTISHEVALAHDVWDLLVRDPSVRSKCAAVRAPWPVPAWSGDLDDCLPIAGAPSAYRVFAVDGSQIYPDRHQGISCFLLNIGTVELNYGTDLPGCAVDSVPYLFTGAADEDEIDTSPESIGYRRELYELRTGATEGARMQEQQVDAPLLQLFDGSLIFWYLEGKDPAVRDYFLGQYLAQLYQLYHHRVLFASYISLPRSREVSNIIRLALCDFKPEGCTAHKRIEQIVDTHVMNWLLRPGTRSTVFEHQGAIARFYPAPLKPHFFYVRVQQEIARVEVPAWIATDQERVDVIARIVVDQCAKGHGYPIALAEAHEQAVVKSADREFFYHVLHKTSVAHQRQWAISQKVARKRRIGI